MEIRARYIIGDFIEKYPIARKPLKRWEDATKEATWKTPADVKKVFSSVSFVGKTTVFNIGGNKWRLLTHILYEQKSVVVTHMLTHREYDNMKIE
jgi:mRNA interferase HigB